VTRTRRVEWPADARAIAVAAVAQQADADAAGGSSDEESSDSDDDDAPSDGDLDDGAAFGVSDGAAPTPSPSAANGGRARVRWEQKGAEALRVLGPRYRRLDAQARNTRSCRKPQLQPCADTAGLHAPCAQVVAAIVDGAVPADVVVGNITDRCGSASNTHAPRMPQLLLPRSAAAYSGARVADETTSHHRVTNQMSALQRLSVSCRAVQCACPHAAGMSCLPQRREHSLARPRRPRPGRRHSVAPPHW
jgi:hypothetical protein